ncbi:MAG TPA: glucosyl-3-phosphoglycerate synthase [Actinomycetota bacterium]|nr:glucosyl-3-phosphoglycerate synthase [Actinomycetota bacterium]
MDTRPQCEFPWLTRLAQRWYDRHTFASSDLPDPSALADQKRQLATSVSVVLPALNEGATIGPICKTITTELMQERPLVDELIVIDGGSTDDTARSARAGGALVVHADDLIPEVPRVPGKGESLWRSLSIASGDIVVWIDADIRNFGPHFVSRLIAPLICDEAVSFVKAFYRRPLAQGDALLPGGGGRVTELLARPLLNTLFPELGGLLQPLSGEYAGRRDVLMQLPFFTGYSVEVGLLIDLLDLVGLEGIAQVDLEERVHRNRPLDELGPMAHAIGKTLLLRADQWGRIRTDNDLAGQPLLLPSADGRLELREIKELERPPLSLLRTSLEAMRIEPAAASSDGIALPL